MPAGWALPGALRCILVLPHPASRHVRAAQPCQPRSKPGLAPSAPSPHLLCGTRWCHRASPGEGVTARAASRGIICGAHRAWTGVRQSRGDTHGPPLPTAPAGAPTPGGNGQVRTAPRSTAREEPQRLPHRPRPGRAPSPGSPCPGTFQATPGGRAGPCSASGHRERDPPPRPRRAPGPEEEWWRIQQWGG